MTHPTRLPSAAPRPDAPLTPPALPPTIADALVAQAPLAVALYDAAGRVAFGNPAYERHFGIRLADVPPDYSLFADPQLAAAGLLPLIRRAYAGDAVVLPPVRYDAARATDGAGRTVWTQGHCYPVRGAAGDVTHVAILQVDVTTWASAEAALHDVTGSLEARNAQLQAQTAELERANDALGRVVAQLPAAVAVLEGRELRFRAASAVYRQIVGGRELLGRPIREALPELSGGEGGADFFALMERVFDSGEAVVGTTERARWDADGDGVLEDHVVDLVYAPLRATAPDGTATGPVEGVTVLVVDVSERADAEAALRESEARFRNMADAAPVMLWVTDPTGGCTFLNRQWLEFTGQTLEEGLGLGWTRAVHPDDAGHAERTFLEATAARGPFRLDYRLRRRDGSYRWALDTAAPRRAPDGTFLGYVGSVVDIDERTQLLASERAARAEAEAARAVAEAADRAKSEFLATMSHELRTPLNAIQGHAALIAMGLHGPVSDEQARALARIDRAQRHLLGLVNDVLNYARLGSGRVEYDVRPTLVADVIDDVLPMVEPQLAAKQLRVEVHLPESGPAGPTGRRPVPVLADREKLGQIFLNLLSNAVKFTAPGGRVTIDLAADGGASPSHASFRVADTGIGIAPEKLELVFEPFVQVRTDYTRETGGTGLGLAISRDLARGMGGELTVESAPGVGSTFTVRLPVA
ncbi:MAG: Sensory box histidine kinase/response regulator [uncultured Gemmatimonadaceae bacterium]|uniref:histidine kinase n=1 Tax=uncultured Gemmatimonadaceae bacterium TaxID=246130 RepID=A0A6J4K012_9BACT|nr:MAG: Sensory box histidine kinase/response regulator [uncultured Gemmatimonadaceae bacterium]